MVAYHVGRHQKVVPWSTKVWCVEGEPDRISQTVDVLGVTAGWIGMIVSQISLRYPFISLAVSYL